MSFINIPVSIILGVILGATTGFFLSLFFEILYKKNHYIRNSIKVIIILGISFLLMTLEKWLNSIISISGLLAVVSMACMLKV